FNLYKYSPSSSCALINTTPTSPKLQLNKTSLTSAGSIQCTVREVFSKFNFLKGPGLLQFWACNTSSKSEDIGCNLILKQQTYRLNGDPQGLLQDYRRTCLENNYPCVGIETSVGNWLAGRVAQTRIADHRTIHRVLNQEDQHSADVGNLGQLVLPVFFGQGAGKKLVGIIEFVTPVAKESYIDDFEQIHSLLKTPKKFTLPACTQDKIEQEFDLKAFLSACGTLKKYLKSL
ncbi:hypothetical protein M8C21_033251, partial [Ambrosia artemisiifolia]